MQSRVHCFLHVFAVFGLSHGNLFFGRDGPDISGRGQATLFERLDFALLLPILGRHFGQPWFLRLFVHLFFYLFFTVQGLQTRLRI